MNSKPLVVIGLLGTQLDQASGAHRWESWRPTVSLCQHEELLVGRLELLHDRHYEKLAETVAADIGGVSPETTVNRRVVEFDDPWDFEEVYGVLADFVRGYPFEPEKEDYLVHITTGTHVAQICLYLLTESRHLPARLIQASPPAGGQPAADSGGTVHDHRPGPVAVRPDRHALRRGAAGGADVSKERDRHAQRGVQPDDRGDRTGGRGVKGTDAVHGGQRARASRRWRGRCSS